MFPEYISEAAETLYFSCLAHSSITSPQSTYPNRYSWNEYFKFSDAATTSTMTSSLGVNGPLISLLQKSFPSAVPAVQGGNDYPEGQIIKAVYPEIEYSNSDEAEISQWLISFVHIACPDQDAAKISERLSSLNTHLSTRTTLLGSKPSIADLALFARLAPVLATWNAEERTGKHGYHHVVRHLNFVQNASLFRLKMEDDEKVQIDVDDVQTLIEPIDPKIEKERKRKEKEAASVAAVATTGPNGNPTNLPIGQSKENQGGHTPEMEERSTGDIIAAAVVGAETPEVAPPSADTKKEKQAKAKKQPETVKETTLSPCLIDLRVGHILKAEAHPNADSLYVSTIACGDPAGTDNTSEYEGQVVRIVCSGLKGLVPLEEMQGRKIVAVCNLKPVTMRGIKSAAMVLAASSRSKEGEAGDHEGLVELVNPPQGATAGERVFFEGWEGEPERLLNPKKKVWEMCQVGFMTTEDCGIRFDARKVEQLEGKSGEGMLRTKAGLCTVKSLKAATVR